MIDCMVYFIVILRLVEEGGRAHGYLGKLHLGLLYLAEGDLLGPVQDKVVDLKCKIIHRKSHTRFLSSI